MPFKDPALKRAFVAKQNKKRTTKWREQGRCVACGAPCAPFAKCEKHRKQWAGYNKTQRRKLFKQFLDAYGAKCECCGETNAHFLTLDHVHGNGHKERRELGLSDQYGVIRKAKREGWPKCYRVLCFNCNCGRQRNQGVCPHKEILVEVFPAARALPLLALVTS